MYINNCIYNQDGAQQVPRGESHAASVGNKPTREGGDCPARQQIDLAKAHPEPRHDHSAATFAD